MVSEEDGDLVLADTQHVHIEWDLCEASLLNTNPAQGSSFHGLGLFAIWVELPAMNLSLMGASAWNIRLLQKRKSTVEHNYPSLPVSKHFLWLGK
jgi:hypothetical protein